MKRAFVRNGDRLVDPTVLGPPISVTSVGFGRREIARRSRDAAISDARRTLTARIGKVCQGDGSDLLVLIPVAERKELLAALAQGLTVVGESGLANFAQAAALVDARELLPALQARWEVSRAHSAANPFVVVALSYSLLALDPDHALAARELLGCLSHSNEGCRAFAAHRIAEIHRLPYETPALHLLRQGAAVVVSDTPAVFVSGLPVALHADEMRAKERVVAMLGGRAHLDELVPRLREVGVEHSLWAAGELRAHIDDVSDDVAVSLAMLAPRLFDTRCIHGLAHRALASPSPSHRLEGIELLRALPQQQREVIATEAAQDEPDAYLQELLTALGSAS